MPGHPLGFVFLLTKLKKLRTNALGVPVFFEAHQTGQGPVLSVSPRV